MYAPFSVGIYQANVYLLCFVVILMPFAHIILSIILHLARARPNTLVLFIFAYILG